MIGFLVRNRIALGWILALAVFFVASPGLRSLAIGTPFALAGLFTRALAAGTIRKGSELARSGPYAYTRNPLYLGSSLLALGFGIMSGSIVGLVMLVLPSALVYPIVVRSEERHLRKRYGPEFDEFRNRVPCFFPRRLPLHALEAFTFDQFRANGEYNATLGFLAAAGILALKYFMSLP